MFAWAVQRGSSALNMSVAWEINRLVVLPLVTVLVLLTNAPDVWYLRTPLVVLSVLALVYETWRSSAVLWFIMAALLGGTIYLNWESNDNHKYLIAYWCLTLCAVFTVGTRHQEATLERSCRSMIGLCMLLAAVWKGATPDYLSGSFFTYELLADERFAQFTDLWGGVPLTTLGEHRELRDLMLHGYERGIELATASFQTSERVRPLALFLTWWTLLIEGALAILFLWPDSPRSARIRNAALLLFAVSTYSVATVRGFGWMLMLLGLAQCPERDKPWRLAYLAAFLLIQIYTLPVASIWTALGG